MRVSRNFAGWAGAAALLLQPQLVLAQDAACVTEAEVAAMVTYAMPSLIEATQARCGPELAPAGFLSTEGGSLLARYQALQATSWPLAKSALLKIASPAKAGQDDNLAMIATLPDEAIKPFVDALIVQEVAKEIPAPRCGSIERLMEAVAPIEPEVAARLVAVAFSLVETRDPPICPA